MFIVKRKKTNVSKSMLTHTLTYLSYQDYFNFNKTRFYLIVDYLPKAVQYLLKAWI